MAVKLALFSRTLESLRALTRLDEARLTAQLSPLLLDAVRNGMAQKFEVAVELCWKSVKEALFSAAGLSVASPKGCFKEAYLQGWIDEVTYLLLMAAVDQRNTLAHIYEEEAFLAALREIPAFADAMDKVRQALEGLLNDTKSTP